MKKRWLASLAALVLGNGLALAQPTYLPEPQTQVLLPEAAPSAEPAREPKRAKPVSQSTLPARIVPSIAQPAAQNSLPVRIVPDVVQPAAEQTHPVATPAVDVLRPVPPEPARIAPTPSAPASGCASACSAALAAAAAPRERDRVWANADYLVWWLRGNHVPPLVGTLPATLAAQNPADLPPGAIATIFGGGELGFHDYSGGRFTLGAWLDPEHIGLEGSFFFVNRNTLSFNASSTGNLVVGPLFFDVTAGKESIIVPVDPTQATETVHASASQRLWGAEINLKDRLCYFGDSPVDILIGFRYMDLQSDLFVNSAINFTGEGTRAFTDSFAAKNRFYGANFGAAIDLRNGPWSLAMAGKLGIGGVEETMVINGFTTETPLGGTTRIFSGGILTARSNIGHFSMTRFALLPEMTFTLGYQVTSNVRLTFGYNFLWLTKAMYAGDAVDAVNPANIRGLVVTNPSNVVRPIPILTQSDLWAHGMNIGAEVRF